MFIKRFVLLSVLLCTVYHCASRRSKSQPTTDQGQDATEILADATSPSVQNQGVSQKRDQLRVEMEPNAAHLCRGDCIDIGVSVAGGNPPYSFSWNTKLPNTTGPHRVCIDADTTYTVTVYDTGLDSQEFEVPPEEARASVTITIDDTCTSTGSIDADSVDQGVDAMESDAADSLDVSDAGDDSDAAIIENTDGSTPITPCVLDCPDLEWVEIKGGTFMMGNPIGVGEDNTYPQHEVTLESYKLLRTEVTVSQYGMCVAAGVCVEPITMPDPSADASLWDAPGRENHPVLVGWYDAKTFAEWVGARLPTEAEWEYAARNRGQDILYPWGNAEGTCEYAVVSNTFGSGCGTFDTAEVCSKPLGYTEQGLCDMIGNMSEVVEDDSHGDYNGAPEDGSAWVNRPRAFDRVSRGGDFQDPCDREVKACRAAYRHGIDPNWRVTGFRLALDV